MNFKRLQIPEIILFEPIIFDDNRGYFTESYRKDKLDSFLGYSINFCQENESKSYYGVMRGLHYQTAPYAQTKLVSVEYGIILDVVVDLRKESKTFGKHLEIELNAKNKKQLLIPKGFAHGFIVLSDKATVSYKLDEYYNPEFERGITYDDNDLGINWRIKNSDIKISEKDTKLPRFKDAEYF